MSARWYVPLALLVALSLPLVDRALAPRLDEPQQERPRREASEAAARGALNRDESRPAAAAPERTTVTSGSDAQDDDVDDDGDVLVRPHPPSPARERMAAQSRLFGAVEAAIAAGEFARARELLEEHRASFSEAEAWSDWREGFLRMADCLEHPGASSRAAGQRFVDVERGSTLRRRVRRACLDG